MNWIPLKRVSSFGPALKRHRVIISSLTIVNQPVFKRMPRPENLLEGQIFSLTMAHSSADTWNIITSYITRTLYCSFRSFKYLPQLYNLLRSTTLTVSTLTGAWLSENIENLNHRHFTKKKTTQWCYMDLLIPNNSNSTLQLRAIMKSLSKCIAFLSVFFLRNDREVLLRYYIANVLNSISISKVLFNMWV